MAIRLQDYKVSTKVTSAFAIVLAATLALGSFAVLKLSQVNMQAQEVSGKWLPGMRTVGEMAYTVARLRAWQGAVTLLKTPKQLEDNRVARAELSGKLTKLTQEYAAAAEDGTEKAIADRILTNWKIYEPTQDRQLEILRTNGPDAAFNYYYVDMTKPYTDFRLSVEAAVKYQAERGTAAGNKGQSTFSTARLLIFGALTLAIGLCLFAGYMLIGAVSTPLGRMTDAMGQLAAGNLDAYVPYADQRDEIGRLADAMTGFKAQLAAAERSKAEQTQVIVSSVGAGLDHLAKGDLTHRVSADLTGPFAKLKDDFNLAMTHLQDTLKNVMTTTGQITNGASEISQAADDLSRRTEQQAASLEETAAALEEITTTVKKTATNARDARESVTSARSAAENGGRVVETAIQAMDSIAQSSRQITDIIGVIDEIAFQTNLLALNAGVEAARAGDAGKGFAVVASEVRALAQRSSEAAKEIKTLIHASGDHVGAGVRLVGESGAALKLIVEQVEQINSLVTEMAQAAEQQSTGIEEVNAAVSQMDQVTQQNAAMVEESTAASRQLARETLTLKDLVKFFNVGDVDRYAVGQKAVSRPAPAKPLVDRAKTQQTAPARRPAVAASVGRKAERVADDWMEF